MTHLDFWHRSPDFLPPPPPRCRLINWAPTASSFPGEAYGLMDSRRKENSSVCSNTKGCQVERCAGPRWASASLNCASVKDPSTFTESAFKGLLLKRQRSLYWANIIFVFTTSLISNSNFQQNAAASITAVSSISRGASGRQFTPSGSWDQDWEETKPL